MGRKYVHIYTVYILEQPQLQGFKPIARNGKTTFHYCSRLVFLLLPALAFACMHSHFVLDRVFARDFSIAFGRLMYVCLRACVCVSVCRCVCLRACVCLWVCRCAYV